MYLNIDSFDFAVHFKGWTGPDCGTPDCPGCEGNGFCNGSTSPPKCDCKEVLTVLFNSSADNFD